MTRRQDVEDEKSERLPRRKNKNLYLPKFKAPVSAMSFLNLKVLGSKEDACRVLQPRSSLSKHGENRP